ncbi:MAG TPA: hypothetical protein DGP89_07175 [Saprospirales bacterium]|mgnify:FL=1|jgi:hypothetical protein|nr:hypothetical protein [Saprospiraceae bacterium]MDA9325645.1 hypothetical protein [bacterium]HCV51112.1 hypothetical protein [Saprospirales bacterium]
MNHKKIKKQINKINSFFESITTDDEISKIEKNLLLSYISKLYESILDPIDNLVAEAKTSKPVAMEKKTETGLPVVEEIEIISTPQEILVKDAVKPIIPVETKKTVNTPASVVIEASKVELSEKMISIFEKSRGLEISDKLGNLPLKDLTKVMGINERMFTIKELFGGNQERFKTVMSDINELSGYDEAKEYLIREVATELKWDSEAHYKKADKFVKLVQRRFS